jgi:transcriptional regulator with XRE-family HTH domain
VERRRRTNTIIAGDREAVSIAATLGREVRTTRRTRRMRQVDLARAVGLTQSRMSQIERGEAVGTPLIIWVRLGQALGRPLAMSFSRDTAAAAPADAGHLDGQELLLGLARATGRPATFELPTRPENPGLSVDVGIRDDPHRTLILNEIWNRFDDFGRATRSSDRKAAEAAALAALAGGADAPYRVAVCWLLVDNAANRAFVARYPEIIRARFPGSSLAWVQALSSGGPVPTDAGIVWLDPRAGRLLPMRHRRRR